MQQRIISYNKGKAALVLVGCLIFVAAGAWMLLAADQEPALRALKMRAIGTMAIVFFGGGLLLGVRVILTGKAPLIIDEEGIIDNSSAVRAGRVRWEEIVEIKTTVIAQQHKVLTVIVSDPEKFIENGSPARQKLNAANSQLSGSPINISTTTLAIGFEELEKLLNDGLAEYRSKAVLPG